MVQLQLTILFATLSVAFAGNIISQSTSLSYRKLEATELVLEKGQQVNFPAKSGRCKPIGQLDVLGCSGTIDKTTFSKLKDLRSLNIIDSDISSLQCDSFSSFKKLESLAIEKSSINFDVQTNIGGRTPLPYFNDLNCRNSSISGLSRNAFYDISSVKKLSVESSTLTKVSTNIFDDMKSIKELSIKSSSALDLDVSLISKLNSLEYLALYKVQSSSSINYNAFQSLSNLQTIRFDASAYKQLDFDAFSSLKTVEIAKSDVNTIDVDSLVNNLSGKGIECVFV